MDLRTRENNELINGVVFWVFFWFRSILEGYYLFPKKLGMWHFETIFILQHLNYYYKIQHIQWNNPIIIEFCEYGIILKCVLQIIHTNFTLKPIILLNLTKPTTNSSKGRKITRCSVKNLIYFPISLGKIVFIFIVSLFHTLFRLRTRLSTVHWEKIAWGRWIHLFFNCTYLGGKKIIKIIFGSLDQIMNWIFWIWLEIFRHLRENMFFYVTFQNKMDIMSI